MITFERLVLKNLIYLKIFLNRFNKDDLDLYLFLKKLIKVFIYKYLNII